MSAAKPSGYGTMQLGDQDRPFQVGTNQADIFCNLQHRKADGRALPLLDYYQLFGSTDTLLGAPLRDFVFSALVAGYQNDGHRVDFTHLDVGNWIDEGDDEEVAKPLNVMLEQIHRKVDRAAERTKNTAPPTRKAAKGAKLTKA